MMKANNDFPEATVEFETADRNLNLFIGYLPCVTDNARSEMATETLVTSLFSELDVRPRLAPNIAELRQKLWRYKGTITRPPETLRQ